MSEVVRGPPDAPTRLLQRGRQRSGTRLPARQRARYLAGAAPHRCRTAAIRPRISWSAPGRRTTGRHWAGPTRACRYARCPDPAATSRRGHRPRRGCRRQVLATEDPPPHRGPAPRHALGRAPAAPDQPRPGGRAAPGGQGRERSPVCASAPRSPTGPRRTPWSPSWSAAPNGTSPWNWSAAWSTTAPTGPAFPLRRHRPELGTRGHRPPTGAWRRATSSPSAWARPTRLPLRDRPYVRHRHLAGRQQIELYDLVLRGPTGRQEALAPAPPAATWTAPPARH